LRPTARCTSDMDELDRKIMALLQLDGRASNAKIAREVGVTGGTVRRRLGRLLGDDFVEIMAVPNLEKLGYTTTALIGLQTMPAKQEAVADAVARLEEVPYVATTTGSYDIFLWVGVESAEQLGRFLRQKLGPIEGIRHSETFVNLFIKKLPTG
jgi:Lrp/AsnC family transcriptional regulator for asnA, asnC and gidA